MYLAGAAAVLAAHLAWLLFVIFGALITRGRPWLTALHVLALVWGIAVEVGPWPCPLTAAEQHLQEKAGFTPYTQPFLVHYLDRLVYPEIDESVLVPVAVAVCAANLAIYVRRLARRITW